MRHRCPTCARPCFAHTASYLYLQLWSAMPMHDSEVLPWSAVALEEATLAAETAGATCALQCLQQTTCGPGPHVDLLAQGRRLPPSWVLLPLCWQRCSRHTFPLPARQPAGLPQLCMSRSARAGNSSLASTLAALAQLTLAKINKLLGVSAAA